MKICQIPRRFSKDLHTKASKKLFEISWKSQKDSDKRSKKEL